MELVFTPHGTVSLLNEDETVLWSSDEDPDFSEVCPEEFLEDPRDTDTIIDYLIEQEFLSDEDEIDITEETLDGEADSEDDDED